MNLKSLILNTILDSFLTKVKVALAGIGNCVSALIQGLEYYRKNPEETVGLVDYSIGVRSKNLWTVEQYIRLLF